MLKKNINVIAFDADDTLWVNEPMFREAIYDFSTMFSEYGDHKSISNLLEQTQIKNLSDFGYGSKSFVISMIETAMTITGGRDCGDKVQKIIAMGKEMQHRPIELLDGVEEVLTQLTGNYKLMLITKGELVEQERKIERSGLADYFSCIEIVSEKDERTYSKCLNFHDIRKDEFLMVGNSVKSDILPVINIGACAVHIPFHTTWCHECVDCSDLKDKEFITLNNAGELLPALL